MNDEALHKFLVFAGPACGGVGLGTHETWNPSALEVYQVA